MNRSERMHTKESQRTRDSKEVSLDRAMAMKFLTMDSEYVSFPLRHFFYQDSKPSPHISIVKKQSSIRILESKMFAKRVSNQSSEGEEKNMSQ